MALLLLFVVGFSEKTAVAHLTPRALAVPADVDSKQTTRDSAVSQIDQRNTNTRGKCRESRGQHDRRLHTEKRIGIGSDKRVR